MDRLFLEIVTPERVMVKEEVDLVEAVGAMGEFGVLPGHVSFLTLLDAGEVHFINGSSTGRLATSGGFGEVVDNRVTLLLKAAEFPEEIDVARAERARERAETRLKELATDDVEYVKHEAALIRAVTRIGVASKRS